MPNIVTLLSAFFCFALMLNAADAIILFVLLALYFTVMCGLLLSGLSKAYLQANLRLLKRFRWFMLVMWLVFAFNVPGEHWQAWPLEFSPTIEGMHAGFVHVLRIILMLCAVSIVMNTHSRHQLISGFYYIFQPLKIFNLNVDRFAVRLYLTFYYVDAQSADKVKISQAESVNSLNVLARFKQQFEAIAHAESDDNVEVNIRTPQFKFVDKVLILIIFLITILALVQRATGYI